MKITRLIVVAMLLVLTGGVAFAQQSKTDETLEFKPHWSLGVQGGVSQTLGESSFGKLLSPSVLLSTQWHFHHALGLRIGVGGWQAKGALVIPDQIVYPYRYLQLNADFVVDLAGIFGGFNHKRVCSPYVFAGVGGAYGFDNRSAAVISDHLPYYWDSKFFVPGRFGLGIDFWLGDVVSIGLEGDANLFSDKFNSKRGGNIDWQFNLLAGLKFRLGKNTRPSKAYAEKVAAQEAAAEAERIAAERLAAEKAAAEKAAAEKAAAEKAAAEAKAAAEKAAAEKAAAEKAAAEAAAVEAAFAAAKVKDIYFTIGSAQVKAIQDKKLVAIAEILKEHPEVTVMFVGYADNATGSPQRNMELSKMRADAAKARLVELGIDPSRITVDHKGCTVQPYQKPEESRVAICTLR